jgi:hypothetical protein
MLRAQGHEVVRLVRSRSTSDPLVAYWNPETPEIESDRLNGIQAVIHLAGETVAGRWTAEKKRQIRDSRIDGTSLLRETLGSLGEPPKIVICASAIGYYGDRGEEELIESCSPGAGFLAEVCRDWENAMKPLSAKDVRVVWLRFGVVLSKNGGALANMLGPFRMGLGGRLGSGSQYMSWIALEDAIAVVRFVLEKNEISGPVNVASPSPVTNREFTKALGRVLRRPTILPMPRFAARAAFGQMADELLLSSARAVPATLQSHGLCFQFPDLEGTLIHLLR